jgi:hypothetical protein
MIFAEVKLVESPDFQCSPAWPRCISSTLELDSSILAGDLWAAGQKWRLSNLQVCNMLNLGISWLRNMVAKSPLGAGWFQASSVPTSG